MGLSRSPGELAARLAALTGDLSAPLDRLNELERARRLLARALLQGDVADDSSATVAAAPTSELRLMAAEEVLAAGQDRHARVVRRDIPIKPRGATETLGPFFTPEQRRVWFDVFAPAGASSSIGAATGPFLVFTDALASTGPLSYSIPAGGVWIRVSSLTGGASSNSFVGFLVTGGVVTFASPPTNPTPPDVTVGAGVTFTVELDIDVPATMHFFSPPSKVSFDFSGESVTAIRAATGRLTVNGAVVDLEPEGPATLAADGTRLQLGGASTTVADTASSTGQSIRLSGKWKVDDARWSFTPETLDPQRPPLPNESGFGALNASGGLGLSWPGVGSPLPIDHAVVLASADHFEMQARSSARGIRHTLRDHDQVLADIRFDPSAPIVLATFEQDSKESRLTTSASVRVTPKRPLTADGSPITISADLAQFGVSESDDAVFLDLRMTPQPARMALALSNALLMVEGPLRADLHCTLGADAAVTSVRLPCRFALKGVLPTLPDPYVANFEPAPQQGVEAHVMVVATWDEAGEPTVAIDVRERDRIAPILLGWMPTPLDDHANPLNSGTRRGQVASTLGREGVGYWMLDVSTNAGQFGVAIGSRNDRAKAAIENSQLQWNGLDALIFSVPAIQWEPVADSTGLMLSVDDGGPSAFAVDTVRLVPVAPAEAARLLVGEHQHNDVGLRADITLPFGIRAFVASDRRLGRPPAVLPPPRVDWAEPKFDDLQSAPRLHIESTSESGMPGFVTLSDNLAGNTNVLDFPSAGGAPVVSTMFRQSFTFQSFTVPLHRYDWSGFGSSAFSHWINPNQLPPSVSQVRFDVLNGRTSHQVVQVSAILWPCQAFLVRTITLERQNNAAVVRHDSGWIASSDGRFGYPGSLCTFHRGVVGGYINIREIRDTPRIIDVGAARFQQVYFDADLEVEGILTAVRNGATPVQRHTGYVQFLPISGDITAADLQELLRREGAVGGPVDCEIEIGAAGPRVLISKLQVETAIRPPGTPEFAVSLNGMPRFPSSGAWTAVRTSGGQTTPVDSGKGVPVIREGAQACRFADAADLFRPLSPQTQYGFLFSTDASRVLLPSPEVQPGSRVITSPFRARLADPYALSIAQGVFPKDTATMEFPSAYVADFAAPVILDQQAAQRSGDLELISNKVMRLYVEAPATFDAVVNAADWKVDSVKQTLFLDLLGFAKLLSMRGEWMTESTGARKFADPQMELSGALEPVKDILEVLKNLKLPFDMDFSLRTEGADTLALEATVAGHLAEPDGSRIDTGMGKLGGSLRLGVVIRASISNGVQGFVYLEVSGDLQQAIIPGLLYAGGHLRFRAGVFDNGDTQLELTAGTVGSIGGDLIKGLIEVEGTVKYGYTLVVPNNNLDQIRIGVVLGMEVRAVMVSGLLGIKFGWEGGALMSLNPPKTHLVITAHVSASASVTAAWVFKARRSITVEYTVEVPRGVVLSVLAVTTFGVGPAAGAAALA